ncbi:MAG: hypothetical protein DRJ10_01645 [Bacteroidetes bacterium]|nr:MAG: hypothetical protein DRJ10_01645 [Bacteroidota bacterium]
MKTRKLNVLIVGIAAVIMSFSYQVNAQKNGRGQGQGWNQQNNQTWNCNIPNLTEIQQTKIEKMRTANMKEMIQSRNFMAEKGANLNTLRTADKVDMNAINKAIDEMGANRTKMMKKREAHRQAIREILTDDQKVYFDSRRGRGSRGGNGQGNGMGRNGQGRGCQRF